MGVVISLKLVLLQLRGVGCNDGTLQRKMCLYLIYFIIDATSELHLRTNTLQKDGTDRLYFLKV